MFWDVPGCSGMFQNVPDFFDGRDASYTGEGA